MAALLGVFGVSPAAIIVAVMDAVDVWAGRLEHILNHALKKESNNLCKQSDKIQSGRRHYNES